MKKTILLTLCVFSVVITSAPAFARGGHYSFRAPRIFSVRTHTVRPYVRKNSTYVKGHLSGNPGSGVHCQNDVCK